MGIPSGEVPRHRNAGEGWVSGWGNHSVSVYWLGLSETQTWTWTILWGGSEEHTLPSHSRTPGIPPTGLPRFTIFQSPVPQGS